MASLSSLMPLYIFEYIFSRKKCQNNIVQKLQPDNQLSSLVIRLAYFIATIFLFTLLLYLHTLLAAPCRIVLCSIYGLVGSDSYIVGLVLCKT